MERIKELLLHSEWADAEWFRLWGDTPAQNHEELRMRSAHMNDVRRGFTLMLQGLPPAWPQPGAPLSYADLKKQTQETHRAFRAMAGGLKREELSELRVIPFFKNPSLQITVEEGLYQVILHTQHHRGQCMTRLKDFGGTPENVDYIIWIWKGRPQPVW